MQIGENSSFQESENYVFHEREKTIKREFYFLMPCFSSQASSASNSNSLSLRSAFDGTLLESLAKRRRHFECQRLKIFRPHVGLPRERFRQRSSPASAVFVTRCTASGIGAACSLVKAIRSMDGRLLMR